MTRRSGTIAISSLALLGICQIAFAQNGGAAQSRAQQKEQAPVPVPVAGGEATLTPQNTTIQFVGTHLGERPDPRTGYFTKFAGALAFDETDRSLIAVRADIEAASLITPIGKLTNHLRGPDFFNAKQYPKATFASTAVESADASSGKYEVTGDLMIRGITKPITFPATLKSTGAGVVLHSKFKIKRSQFGMTFGPDRVHDDVAMTIVVGQRTPKLEAGNR